MLRLLLSYDREFSRVQEHYQEHYLKLCQVLTKAQRYPVGRGNEE